MNLVNLLFKQFAIFNLSNSFVLQLSNHAFISELLLT